MPAPARADTYTLGRFGEWEAFGGTSTTGQPVCGVSTGWSDGRYFAIKYWQGRDNFVVQMMSRDWRFAPGTQIPISLQFDALSPWTATVRTSQASATPGMMAEFNVPFGRLENVLREFRLAYAGKLTFSGMDRPWVLDLTGSNAASQTMDGCVQRLAGAPMPQQPAPMTPLPVPQAPAAPAPALKGPMAPGNKF